MLQSNENPSFDVRAADDQSMIISSRLTDMIVKAYTQYWALFHEITSRAQSRFQNKEWLKGQQDALERLDLYSNQLEKVVAEIQKIGLPDLRNKDLWEHVKEQYTTIIASRTDRDLAATFFNSICRHIFQTIGVNPSIEFTTYEFKDPMIEVRECPVCSLFEFKKTSGALDDVISEILRTYCKNFNFYNFVKDVGRVTRVLSNHLEKKIGLTHIDSIEMIHELFYRDKAAYLIGRIQVADHLFPFIICLLNKTNGVIVDALLLNRNDARILFSFTRSDFHVKIENLNEMILFLKTILPSKPISELYSAIGLYKHGKAEFFRELTRSLDGSDDKFQISAGQKGMVMIVFTLPSLDVVFKVIKDRFDFPKKTNRQDVKRRYQLVFRHDRSGRLLEAQEFEHLSIDRKRFSGDLLDELLRNAGASISIHHDDVIIHHVYTERRITPLDVYIQNKKPGTVQKALLDYGQAVKDLAAVNIFPGDLLLKNFGVTNTGRVVFYDYDELCLLTECRFRRIPEAHTYEDELASDPWFLIDEKDVFPEELRNFMGLPEQYKKIFQMHHGEIFDAGFWKNMQTLIHSGEVIHIFPYKNQRRLV